MNFYQISTDVESKCVRFIEFLLRELFTAKGLAEQSWSTSRSTSGSSGRSRWACLCCIIGQSFTPAEDSARFDCWAPAPSGTFATFKFHRFFATASLPFPFDLAYASEDFRFGNVNGGQFGIFGTNWSKMDRACSVLDPVERGTRAGQVEAVQTYLQPAQDAPKMAIF